MLQTHSEMVNGTADKLRSVLDVAVVEDRFWSKEDCGRRCRHISYHIDMVVDDTDITLLYDKYIYTLAHF